MDRLMRLAERWSTRPHTAWLRFGIAALAVLLVTVTVATDRWGIAQLIAGGVTVELVRWWVRQWNQLPLEPQRWRATAPCPPPLVREPSPQPPPPPLVYTVAQQQGTETTVLTAADFDRAMALRPDRGWGVDNPSEEE